MDLKNCRLIMAALNVIEYYARLGDYTMLTAEQCQYLKYLMEQYSPIKESEVNNGILRDN